VRVGTRGVAGGVLHLHLATLLGAVVVTRDLADVGAMVGVAIRRFGLGCAADDGAVIRLLSLSRRVLGRVRRVFSGVARLIDVGRIGLVGGRTV
jgi:hypothetical protein